MRAVIQRVANAKIVIGGEQTKTIGQGLVVLLGICSGDTIAQADYLADKCTGLRIFTDEKDKMNLSLRDIGGELLIVSNFTLYGDTRRGKRPSFMLAASPEEAEPLYEHFIERCCAAGYRVETGKFGADMQITLTNDGPVTIFMDTADR